MQGTYRIREDGADLFESFVAAPGPAGWRYFGRVFDPDGRQEVRTVDFVVDTEWGLVRYLERRADGAEVLVVPVPGGLEVDRRDPGGGTTTTVLEAELVWSRSPCCLVVAEHRARAISAGEFRAVRVAAGEPAPLLISLGRMEGEAVAARSGPSSAGKIQVTENGRTITALMRDDMALSAEGWFDLVA